MREPSHSLVDEGTLPSLYFNPFSRLKASISRVLKPSDPVQTKMKGHRVTWDEAKIREYEERKPVRKKITEPKTPYHPMIDADNGSDSPSQNSGEFIDNSANAEALIRALNKVASFSNQRQFGGWTSSEDEMDNDLEQSGVTDESGKRKASYDEFVKSIMIDEFSDEDREIEIEGSGDSLRTIEIEGSEESAGDVEILEGDVLSSTVISSNAGK